MYNNRNRFDHNFVTTVTEAKRLLIYWSREACSHRELRDSKSMNDALSWMNAASIRLGEIQDGVELGSR
jgi:hypothetical protein